MMRGAALLLALATGGCSTLSEVHAGPVVGLAKDVDPTGGVAIDAHGGLGFSNAATDTLGVDFVARVKVTKTSQHMGFGEGFFVASKYGEGVGIFRAGLHFIFERFDNSLLVGGGPYASLAGGYILRSRDYFSPGIFLDETRRERLLLTFGPAIELDARFSRPSSLTFIGFNIGLAWADEHVSSGNTVTPPSSEEHKL